MILKHLSCQIENTLGLKRKFYRFNYNDTCFFIWKVNGITLGSCSIGVKDPLCVEFAFVISYSTLSLVCTDHSFMKFVEFC